MMCLALDPSDRSSMDSTTLAWSDMKGIKEDSSPLYFATYTEVNESEEHISRKGPSVNEQCQCLADTV